MRLELLMDAARRPKTTMGVAVVALLESIMSRSPFMVVFVGRHRYCFVYQKGREEELIQTMIEYAIDERYNFSWAELKSITSHMHAQQGSKGEKS